MAGEIFGECALELRTQFSWQSQNLMKLHSSCTLIFRGRCNIWCSSTFSWQAPNFDEVAFKLHIDFSWQVQYYNIWRSSTVTFPGAIHGKIWNDSRRSVKRCNFHYKMRVVSAKSNPSCRAGCGLTGSWSIQSCSDHAQIGPALQITLRFSRFQKKLSYFECCFSWQAQYLVMSESDFCVCCDYQT